MGAASRSVTFSGFSHLPGELRNQIWWLAAPRGGGRQGLFFYRKGCWCPLGVDPEHEDLIIFEFCDNLLDPVKVDVALAMVNREARGIALSWAAQHGFDAFTCKEEKRAVFSRSFSSNNDALYVGLDQWKKFCVEPYDRLGKPDLLNQTVTPNSQLSRLAIPEALFWEETSDIAEIFDWYCSIEVLFIIMNTPSELEPSHGNGREPPRWELDTTHYEKFVYDSNEQCFLIDEDVEPEDEEFMHRMQDALDMLVDGLVKNRVRKFEVYPVLAVKP